MLDFENKIIEKCKSEKPEILDSISKSGKLEENAEKSLTEVILELKKTLILKNGKFRRFKKRISSVKSTQKITKAMKMVAASKLRRAQESAEKEDHIQIK